MPSFRILRLTDACYAELIAHARREAPNECCGLLAGVVESDAGRIVRSYPLVNVLASPRRYAADPRTLLRIYRDIDATELHLLAIYHSHPTTTAVPSATDHEQWGHGPDIVCLILSLVDDPPAMRGWWMTDTEHHEAEWEVV